MEITWEDRKNIGSIDDEILSIKPEFSFEYAWFLVNGKTAQFVATHEEGTYNEDMSEEMSVEVLDFYNSYIFQGIKPNYDGNIEKLVENGIEIIEGKKYKKYLIEPLTELELEQKRKEIYMPMYTMPDGENLFVREIGQGEPVLVLSGLGMHSWQWLPFLLPKFRGSHARP